MSKPTVEAPAPVAGVAYNPLSKLAILGLSCAALYTFIMIVNAMTAVSSNTPPFLPDALLILPIAGAGLSLLAARQIRNAEGTLSGEQLARWGLWLSVLTGLGYGAFYLATGLAVQQQANHFMLVKGDDSGFFEHLQAGDVNRAFLLTLPPPQRKNISPTDLNQMAIWEQPKDARDPRGPLTQFAESLTAQMIIQAGKEKKPIQALGVKLWKYERGEYLVERNYRIETSEVTLDIVVPVKSYDAPGEPRKWNVLWGRVGPIPGSGKLTPLGKTIDQLRGQASLFFQPWADNLSRGKVDPPCTKDLTDWGSAPMRVVGEEMQKTIRQDLEAFFSGKDKSPRLAKFPTEKFIPWQEENGHIQFFLNLVVQVPFRPGANDPLYTAEVQFVVQSKDPASPMQVTQPLTWEPAAFKVLQFRELSKKKS